MQTHKLNMKRHKDQKNTNINNKIMKKTQCEKLLMLLSDNKPHSTVEIMRRVYGGMHLGLARPAARVYDLKKKYNVEITCKRHPKIKSIYYYTMTTPLDLSLI